MGLGGYIELIERSVQLHRYIVQLQSGQDTAQHHLSTTVTVISSVAFPFCVGSLAQNFVSLALAKLNGLKLVISVGFSVH